MSFRSSLPSLFLPVLLLASAPGNTAANNAVNRAVRLSLAESFVTANLLTSGDAVRFGFWDFDPNTLLNLNDDNFGSLESQELRQRITTFSLPYTWQTPLAETGNTLTLGAKAAYVENAQETQIISSTSQAKDEIKSSVSSLSAGAAFSRRLSTHWDITFSTYAHWMRYRNDTQFNTADSQAIAPPSTGLSPTTTRMPGCWSPAAGSPTSSAVSMPKCSCSATSIMSPGAPSTSTIPLTTWHQKLGIGPTAHAGNTLSSPASCPAKTCGCRHHATIWAAI